MTKTNQLAKLVRRDDLFNGPFKPCGEYAQETYSLLNRYIFDNGLDPAQLEIKRTRGYWGMCVGTTDIINDSFYVEKIVLSSRFAFKAQFIATLAHEMVHQFQWDVLSNERWGQGKQPIMSHGPSFFAWREPLSEYFIPLKREI